MTESKRVFVLGAGFSKAAGMPLATELLPLLLEQLDLDEMSKWLDGLRQRLAWLSGGNQEADSFSLNIEQIFHYAHFDIEVHRLRQHLATVGRGDGPGAPWNQAESIGAWLSYLEDALRDVIVKCEERARFEPIERWAKVVTERDTVLTFNYDTLAERSLARNDKAWNHGMGRKGERGTPVYKLHGSIDWIVAHRSESFSKLDLLFDKVNSNREDGQTGHVEDDCRLWRCKTLEQLKKWIEGRDFQLLPKDASPRMVGIAGLGAYKELHQVPGLGRIWTRGMRALYEADMAIIVGFSMSDFDAMAQIQFAEVARARTREKRLLPVVVVDPSRSKASKCRFVRVFRNVNFVEKQHEKIDWLKFDGA
jgi:hypothetical protein